MIKKSSHKTGYESCKCTLQDKISGKRSVVTISIRRGYKQSSFAMNYVRNRINSDDYWLLYIS